jgi:hypothetical protein
MHIEWWVVGGKDDGIDKVYTVGEVGKGRTRRKKQVITSIV